jgi:microcystin-dependent protein
MADLIVKPSYTFGSRDIITAEKLNLMATPVVELALQDPVNDQNFFRNGNFYSSFWTTPAGVSCPVNVWTTNASYWLVRPQGAAVTFLRSSTVPDTFSLFTGEIQGAASVTTVEIGQQISGDLSATLRRKCTLSGYIYNATGLTVSPVLNIYTANTFNNFGTITLQSTVNLQTVPSTTWVFVSATIDLSLITYVNVANGLLLAIQLPSGAINDPSKNVLFSRLKFQIGEVATEFVDDTSLFVQAPSVDSTMLQDGCLARPGLYVTNPGIIPKNAYGAASIQGKDIGTGEVKGSNLDPGISTTTSALFTTPAANANVGITVTSATAISAGLVLNIQGAGLYSTVSVSGNVVTVMNTGAAGNASSGTAVASGATVTTSGNAVVGCLGYTPVNKAGDTGIGTLQCVTDTVVGNSAFTTGAVVAQMGTTNANNDGYFPAIGFHRPGVLGRAIGLSTTNRFKTVDNAGTIGYLLDTVTGVDTNSYQDASITYAKLAQSLINFICPVGMISAFGGPGPPSGWFVCDGSAVSRTTYSALFSAIGTYWGGGNGVSTFNVPNLVNRTLVGYGTGAFWGFATAGGETSHTLSLEEMPLHNHNISDPGHSHGIPQVAHHHSYVNPTGGFGSQAGSSQYSPAGTVNTSDTVGVPPNTNVSGIGVSMGTAGNNWGHNNMQPYAVIYYIIKAT